MKYLLPFFLSLQICQFLTADRPPHSLLLADHTTRQYMILNGEGEVIWQRPGKGLFEAWALADGSLLLADRDQVQKVIPGLEPGDEDTVVWTYPYASGVDLTGLPSGMIYTCTPLRDGNVLVTESGSYRIVELDANGKVDRVIPLPAPAEENQQSLRLARKTDTGTYLVCYMYEGKIHELNGRGGVIRTIDVNHLIDEPGPSAYEAIPMDNGRLLVSLGPSNKIVILDREGALEWVLEPDDLPSDWNLSWITKVFPRENGNLVVLNYCKGEAPVKAFEITMDKEIVWELRDPRVKGLTSLQILTDDLKGTGLPEPMRKRRHALGTYPELDGLKILCVRRGWPKKDNSDGDWPKRVLAELALPTNHTSTSSIRHKWYNNEIGIFDVSTGEYRTLYRQKDGYFVGHIDLHWNAEKFLFTQADEEQYSIYEMRIDGTGLRKVSDTPPDVDCYEPCYLPDGRIVFESNAAMQGVPCWHGFGDRYIANLFIMNPDGSGMRRLTFDQDHDTQPSVRNNGQVVYGRWDYTGINRVFNRPLMAMNPDGSNQRSIYGSNSYYPNGMYSMKELPGRNGEFLGIVSGYHGSYHSGILTLFDLNKGTREDRGLVRQISGSGSKLPVRYIDLYTQMNWPEFITPSPVTADLYLASAWMDCNDKEIGIYLADREDNLVQLFENPGFALLEPIAIVKQPHPAVIPDRVDPEKSYATVYIQDIYAGPGLSGVPRGTVTDIRVIAYDFGYDDLSGQNKIGLAGPWDAMRIVGTTPVEEDGSVIFNVPANTPLALQPLDSEGKAVQLMRSWMTAMPGEVLSCVGCHESSGESPLPRMTLASRKAPAELTDWYGPQRGFDFEREVQPVLNRYCVSCHDASHEVDLRGEKLVSGYVGRVPGRLDTKRLHKELQAEHDGRVLYTQAYEELLQYVRRVNVADTVALLEPGEYHADTSELIQILQQGHYGIEMDAESWSRLVTWIDLNAPCHGTWKDVFNRDTPFCATLRRRELGELYGRPPIDPEFIPETYPYDQTPVQFEYKPKRHDPVSEGALGVRSPIRKSISVGLLGDVDVVNLGGGSWMATCEVTNSQYARFDPQHDSLFYWKRALETDPDERGVPLNNPKQPVLRVSWNDAMAFCEWISQQTGYMVTLPTEEEWEFACLAGKEDLFHFEGADFSPFENLADRTFATAGIVFAENVSYADLASGTDMVIAEGVDLADKRFDDGAVVTTAVGSYKPNAFGLYDMHGNVAEWTLTDHGPGEKIVKGGSFLDRPERAGADVRQAFPPWQRVHDVGFRIVLRLDESDAKQVANAQ